MVDSFGKRRATATPTIPTPASGPHMRSLASGYSSSRSPNACTKAGSGTGFESRLCQATRNRSWASRNRFRRAGSPAPASAAIIRRCSLSLILRRQTKTRSQLIEINIVYPNKKFVAAQPWCILALMRTLPSHCPDCCPSRLVNRLNCRRDSQLISRRHRCALPRG